MSLVEAESLFSQGRYLEVGLISDQLSREGNLRAQQLYALALSKPGASGAGENILGRCTSQTLVKQKILASWVVF